ncbi:MAG: hypothetical protein WD794_15720 [Mycobacteriales bacterium]
MTGAGLAAAALVVSLAAGAWACVSGPAVLLSTDTVKAGESVQIVGSNFRQKEPVVVRFDALDGPVLAELGVPVKQRVTGSVTIPPGTAAGNYVLVFTQTAADGTPTQVPARTLVKVPGESGALPVVAAPMGAAPGDRLDSLATTESVGGGTLALASLGVAGIALFAVGVTVFATGRRSAAPSKVTVSR